MGEFRLPLNRKIKKLSRGQQSAVGVIVGLASRAPLTFFDEPYLGLDAVARQRFYDLLLKDYAEHPRTVILSTHLIDEVSNLLEHVLVIDDGQNHRRPGCGEPARHRDHPGRHGEVRRRVRRRPSDPSPRRDRRPRLRDRRRARAQRSGARRAPLRASSSHRSRCSSSSSA